MQNYVKGYEWANPSLLIDNPLSMWYISFRMNEKGDKRQMTDTLFDDTYMGARFRYGLNYRPLHSSHVPKGFIIWSDRKSEAFRTFGTVDYPRELTQHEIDTFELTPVPIS